MAASLVLASFVAGVTLAQEPAPARSHEAAVLDRVLPAVVRIEAIRSSPNAGRMTKSWTAGSGVIVTADGHVLTNCHVATDADYYKCYLFDGREVEAHRVGEDAMTDLAVLKLDFAGAETGGAPLVVAQFGNSDQLTAGEPVFALGSPGFLAQSVTRGIVSNPSLVLPERTTGRKIIKGEDISLLVRWILHDATIFGGNSGGPLVNARGEVVGINELGVVNLSGAIPGNLAREVLAQLLAHGRVIRGWSGLTVQARLESHTATGGVLVADVAAGSPAEAAGLRAGDVVLALAGERIEASEEKAVAHFYRLEAAQGPGAVVAMRFERDGRADVAQVQMTERPRAQADNVEMTAWGAVVRDLTPLVVRDQRLPDARGVWIENLRASGPAGQAEPELRARDVLIAVDDTSVADVAELRDLTQRLLADAPGGKRVVLATVWREGAMLRSVVELRETRERNVTAQARRAWLGLGTQPLTAKLAARLGLSGPGGARVTRVDSGTQAEAAGLLVGDVIVAIDGAEVNARRAEDTEVFARQIRQYRAGTVAKLTIWRDGQKQDVPVMLETQPTPATEMPWWEDVPLEYALRDLAFEDRVRLQLGVDAKGVLVESVERAGWADLGGLKADDLITAVGGEVVGTLEEYRRARDAAAGAGGGWLVLLVRRGGQTVFVEINLKSLQP